MSGSSSTTWCVPCGAKSIQTTATMMLDEAPYCVPCARLDGYGQEEIAQAQRAFGRTGSQAAPAPAKPTAAPTARPTAPIREHPQRPKPRHKPEDGPPGWCKKCHKIKIRPTSKTGICSPCQMAWRLDNPKRLALEARDAKAATDLSGALPPAHTQKAENVIYNIKGMHRFNNIIADEVRDAQIPQETHSEAAPSEAPSQENDMTSAQDDVKDAQPETMAVGLSALGAPVKCCENGNYGQIHNCQKLQQPETVAIEPRMCLSVTNCHIDRMLAGLPLEIKVRMVQEYLDRIAE